ncbi:hypothetical protein EG832_05870 [bacterium]|nr:hypothetical protein [bacterium]
MSQKINILKDRLIKSSLIFLIFSFLFDRFTSTVADPDLWGYMSFGRLFWTSRYFPYLDTFSYVPTLKPWVYHEWLTGVVFYTIFENFGSVGLQLIKFGTVFLTLGFVYLTARSKNSDPFSTALGIVATGGLLRMGYAPVRAQIFTYLFFALSLYLLECARKTGHRKCLLFLIPVQIVWCNLHGGFVAGLGLVFLYALGAMLSKQSSRYQWLILILSGLSTAINPYGLTYWIYILRAITMSRPMITEWSSVVGILQSGEHYQTAAYFILLTIFAVIWVVRARPDITSILICSVTLYLGWTHIRHIPLFAIFFGCHFPSLLSIYVRNFKSNSNFEVITSRSSRIIIVLTALLIGIYYVQDAVRQGPFGLKTPDTPIARESGMYYPVGALDFIKAQHLSGKLLVHFEWGEYAIWSLSPQCSVALDGRLETVYPQKVIDEYFDFLYGKVSWNCFLIEYAPDLILVNRQFRSYSVLLNARDWQQIYQDRGSALFRRGVNRDIEPYETNGVMPDPTGEYRSAVCRDAPARLPEIAEERSMLWLSAG